MPKKWPNECSFGAFNAPKSEMLKADCSELVFKNVLPARAGSTFLQNDENEMHQSKKNIENAFCNLHFQCKNFPMADRHSYFAFRSATASVFVNHKISSMLAGLNAHGRRGEIRGGV